MAHRISDDKLLHIRGVAELMYDVSLSVTHIRAAAEQAFLLGLVHDIGYIRQAENHSSLGAEILYQSGYRYHDEVGNHGRLVENPSRELEMLWYCDLRVNHRGERCTFDERLAGIAERYGKTSSQYQNAHAIVEHLREKCPYLMEQGG